MVRGLFDCLGEVVVLDSEDKEICRRNFVFGSEYREHVSLAVYTYTIFAISICPVTRSYRPDISHWYRL